ncbi:MAG: tyrosine-protein phosphatase [Oscillospiraceae bacterium]|nr:tyrosine-protein phosphatase [Oscillospiraceae bacterium]
MIAEQSLPLAGVGNARQLGGYQIGDRRIKDGVLLRTASLDHITPEALEALRDRYRVQAVIDLRMSVEHRLLPDRAIPGAQNLHLPVIEMEDMPERAAPILAEMLTNPGRSRIDMFEAVYESGYINDQLYVGFLLGNRGIAAFRAFFDALLNADEDRAILWHCTDGKDRTGCAAMLLLSALGADRETVMRDYLLTNTCNAALLDEIRQRAAPLGMPPHKLNALLVMTGGVDAAYMRNAIHALDRKFGGVPRYLSDALGVGRREIELLRSKYLTALPK